jgi:hypothetical protein
MQGYGIYSNGNSENENLDFKAVDESLFESKLIDQVCLIWVSFKTDSQFYSLVR